MRKIIICLALLILLLTAANGLFAQNRGSQTITGTVVAIDEGTWRWQAIVVNSAGKRYFVYTFSTGYPDIKTVGVVDKIGKTVKIYYSKINSMRGYSGEIIPSRIVEVKKSNTSTRNSNVNTCQFCGIWKYYHSDVGNYSYLKISDAGTGKFRLIPGYIGLRNQIVWQVDEGSGLDVKNANGIYLTLSNGGLVGSFISYNFRTTGGRDQTYRIVCRLKPKGKMTYSVTSQGFTESFEASPNTSSPTKNVNIRNQDNGSELPFSDLQKGRYSRNVPNPSSSTRTINFRNIATFDIPANWNHFSSDTTSVFTPEGAYGKDGVSHGMLVGVYNGQESFEESSRNILRSLMRKSTGWTENPIYLTTKISGRNGLTTSVSGRGKIFDRDETATFYTTELNNGWTLYIFMGNPVDEISIYSRVFIQISDSLTFTDGSTQSPRGKLPSPSPTTSEVSFSSFIDPYLNKNYPNWKVTSEADLCSEEFSKSFIKGDFNGDGKEDYALKFVQGRKGYIIAFLQTSNSFSSHILENTSADDIKGSGMSISKKSERYPVGGEYPNYRYRPLPNDAPLIGPCASHAKHYVYRNGKFY